MKVRVQCETCKGTGTVTYPLGDEICPDCFEGTIWAENGLTDAEHQAMKMTADLWNLMVREVIADGPAGEQDRAEFCVQIHAVQHTIMAQAAGRAHPGMYRLLGESLHD